MLSHDELLPIILETKRRGLALAKLKVLERQEEICQLELGGGKQWIATKPVPINEFKCPVKQIGVYVIGHVDGRIADVGQGNVLNRVVTKRQFLAIKQRKLDKTKDYRMAEALKECDPDPDQWLVQFIAMGGLTAKDQSKEIETSIHNDLVDEDNAPMFASQHMAGVG
jgi:hypothetical protein